MGGIGKHVRVAGMACLVAGCTMHLDKPVVVKHGDTARSVYLVDGPIRLFDGVAPPAPD